ncbi:unnamed protein product [Protopolystoma xenopodis]|uniref:Uncharacterized protein n=1 Tax=Protopolystoma xenopodis TaxID=117903 RepID=A0A448XBT2_9PLAT|nr:unnamed protein product [Protopolystoma xenopodis]
MNFTIPPPPYMPLPAVTGTVGPPCYHHALAMPSTRPLHSACCAGSLDPTLSFTGLSNHSFCQAWLGAQACSDFSSNDLEILAGNSAQACSAATVANATPMAVTSAVSLTSAQQGEQGQVAEAQIVPPVGHLSRAHSVTEACLAATVDPVCRHLRGPTHTSLLYWPDRRSHRGNDSCPGEDGCCLLAGGMSRSHSVNCLKSKHNCSHDHLHAVPLPTVLHLRSPASRQASLASGLNHRHTWETGPVEPRPGHSRLEATCHLPALTDLQTCAHKRQHQHHQHHQHHQQSQQRYRLSGRANEAADEQQEDPVGGGDASDEAKTRISEVRQFWRRKDYSAGPRLSRARSVDPLPGSLHSQGPARDGGRWRADSVQLTSRACRCCCTCCHCFQLACASKPTASPHVASSQSSQTNPASRVPHTLCCRSVTPVSETPASHACSGQTCRCRRPPHHPIPVSTSFTTPRRPLFRGSSSQPPTTASPTPVKRCVSVGCHADTCPCLHRHTQHSIALQTGLESPSPQRPTSSPAPHPAGPFVATDMPSFPPLETVPFTPCLPPVAPKTYVSKATLALHRSEDNRLSEAQKNRLNETDLELSALYGSLRRPATGHSLYRASQPQTIFTEFSTEEGLGTRRSPSLYTNVRHRVATNTQSPVVMPTSGSGRPGRLHERQVQTTETTPAVNEMLMPSVQGAPSMVTRISHKSSIYTSNGATLRGGGGGLESLGQPENLPIHFLNAADDVESGFRARVAQCEADLDMYGDLMNNEGKAEEYAYVKGLERAKKNCQHNDLILVG